MSAQASRWLPYAGRIGSGAIRLFCFAHSGASALMYRPWLGALGPDVEVCAVELPGHGTRIAEPLHHRLESLVSATAEALLPHFDRPFAIFGHSMGALLGFELTRLLAATAGPLPGRLVVSGHEAPHLPETHPPLHGLPEEQFEVELRRLGGTPEGLFRDRGLRQLMFPILRADFEVCETYLYREAPPLRCPITALAGLHDPFVGRCDLEAWRAHTSGGFDLQLLPGDHFYVTSARHLLLPVLDQHLASMQSESIWIT
ncbi:MAG: thioesterase II family protein [Anaerolineae bacterium]